jgi:hypothetical protein
MQAKCFAWHFFNRFRVSMAKDYRPQLEHVALGDADSRSRLDGNGRRLGVVDCGIVLPPRGDMIGSGGVDQYFGHTTL